MALACRDEVESRVVIRRAARWEVQHGPFQPRFFRRLPSRGWTLLVQDVNHFLAQGRELLQRFDFIPYSRLDDLMVSYAPAGGGVGPHFDSYDVFLLQGLGQRALARQQPARPHAGRRRAAEAAGRLPRRSRNGSSAPGDMLYLPPAWAHDGVAARPLHDLLDRLPRAGLAGARRRSSLRICRTGSPCAGAMPTRL